MEIDGKAKLVEATPTIDTAIYASGDQLGSLMTFENAVDGSSETGVIMSVTIFDGAKQNAALDILFFNSEPTIISSDNAALDISDSEMASKFLGSISFSASDYKSLANNSHATIRTVGMFVQATNKNSVNPTGMRIYAILQSRGTPTYTSTSDLKIKVGMLQD